MRLIECIHTNSNCYKLKGGYNSKNIGYQPKYGIKVYPMTPVGIIVHSTGKNYTLLKRYVQPSKDDKNYKELIKIIGLNKNNNSWNRGVSKAVHYVIGKLADGTIATAHTMPLDIPAWGVGHGSKGSYNYSPAYIQFEICEDDLKHEDYFRAIYKEATELCAYICKQYGWNESVVICHKEAHSRGYASNHADITHWLKKYGLTMANFRADVKKLLDGVKPSKPIEVGDAVNFTGEKHYTNSGALLGKTAKPCACIVKQIYKLGKAKHPYLVKGASVNGWVNAEDLNKG